MILIVPGWGSPEADSMRSPVMIGNAVCASDIRSVGKLIGKRVIGLGCCTVDPVGESEGQRQKRSEILRD